MKEKTKRIIKKLLISLFILDFFTLWGVGIIAGRAGESSFTFFSVMANIFLCFAIFLILNSVKYIEHRKFYMDLPILAFTSNEGVILFHVWVYLLMGISTLIMMTVITVVFLIRSFTL